MDAGRAGQTYPIKFPKFSLRNARCVRTVHKRPHGHIIALRFGDLDAAGPVQSCSPASFGGPDTAGVMQRSECSLFTSAPKWHVLQQAHGGEAGAATDTGRSMASSESPEERQGVSTSTLWASRSQPLRRPCSSPIPSQPAPMGVLRKLNSFFLSGQPLRTAPRDHQLPTANCQLPTANCQLPTANCQQQPTANRRLLPTHRGRSGSDPDTNPSLPPSRPPPKEVQEVEERRSRPDLAQTWLQRRRKNVVVYGEGRILNLNPTCVYAKCSEFHRESKCVCKT